MNYKNTVTLMDVVGWLTKTETVEMTGCSGNGQTTANLLNCSSSAAAGNAMCNVQRCIPVSTDDASVERPRNLVFHDTVIMDRHKELILQRHHCHHIHIYSCKLPHHCNLNTPNHSCLHSVSALAISVTALAISVEERHGVAILRA